MHRYLYIIALTAFLGAQGPPPTPTPTQTPEIAPTGSQTPLRGDSPGASTGDSGVRFVLSEVEALKLENLKLKRDLLQCQVANSGTAFGNELNTFVSSTLKGHGNPGNVEFDPQKWQFVVKKPVENAK